MRVRAEEEADEDDALTSPACISARRAWRWSQRNKTLAAHCKSTRIIPLTFYKDQRVPVIFEAAVCLFVCVFLGNLLCL